jgi:tetratricopeptide (TPR) repeat protein
VHSRTPSWGEVYTGQGRADEGLAEALRGVELDPADYWTQSALGFVRGLRGEWSDAVGPHREAVRLQPNLAFLQVLLSDALRRTGQYDEAVQWAQSALALGQGYDVRAYVAIGHALWLKRDLEGAIGNFQKALSLDDSDAYAHWGLGAVLYRKGQYDQAAVHLRKAAALQPAEPQYHSWLGACLVNLKRYREAKAELERALKLDPTITEAQDLLGQLKAAGY